MSRLVSSIWDRLPTLTATRDAAVATSGGDDRYSDDEPGDDGAPKLRRLNSHDREANADVIGKRFGKFMVLGLPLLKTSGMADGASWVCRCDCGAYETRKKKSLHKSGPFNLQCHACQEHERRRAKDLSSKAPTKARLAEEAASLDELAAAQRAKRERAA